MKKIERSRTKLKLSNQQIYQNLPELITDMY